MTTLVAVETDDGVVLMSRDELEQVVRAQLADSDLVADLLESRRRASANEPTG